MSMHMQFVAPQTHLWCHKPHAPYMQEFITLLICSTVTGIWPSLSKRDLLVSKKTHMPEKSSTAHMVEAYTA